MKTINLNIIICSHKFIVVVVIIVSLRPCGIKIALTTTAALDDETKTRTETKISRYRNVISRLFYKLTLNYSFRHNTLLFWSPRVYKMFSLPLKFPPPPVPLFPAMTASLISLITLISLKSMISDPFWMNLEHNRLMISLYTAGNSKRT